MFHVDSIMSSGSLYRAIMDRKDHCVAPRKWYHHWFGLHAWSLLRHYELATRKILIRLGKKYCQLQRKDMFPIEILMQAIEVIPTISGVSVELVWSVPLRGKAPGTPRANPDT